MASTRPSRPNHRTLAFRAIIACVCASAPLAATAQPREYALVDGRWTLTDSQPQVGADPALVAARDQLDRGNASTARSLVDAWFEANPDPRGPLVPEALLLRGDAYLADDNEHEALRDYERVAREFSGTDALPVALERQLRVANLYLGGLRVRMWGLFRIDSGVPLAEEIIIRINERLPGSRLAEQALLDLADYYYTARELRQAGEAYEIFLRLYPRSDKRELAMQRRLYANIARFKGPRYDASVLADARAQIEDFSAEFPAQARDKGLDDALVARIDESLAAEMLEVARWYLRTDDPVSARLTLNRLVRRHPRTLAALEAAEIMRPRGWLPTADRPGTLTPREPETVVPVPASSTEQQPESAPQAAPEAAPQQPASQEPAP